uniref:Uncharacterized protein n=1 Tax=Skeletonema marinoi TaxID=267567 RepID=A0A7S2KUT9_9STRA|mmetsp:Transcript_16375/g.27666  ORF Transcript_16375/g.27666 Transcript_16375/m.27666 type:complete len:318 (+) Transcript_16375:169-1122(+)
MKKLMSGLRRNRNSIGSSSSTDNVSSSSDDVNTKEAITDDVNYADLFDNDDDENSKENNLNNNTQRHQNRKSTIIKKRKKLHNSKKVAAVTSTKVMPMMTISEMVECEEDEESTETEDESEGEGVHSDDVTVVEEEDDDIYYLLDEDEETTNEESNEEMMEDGEALLDNNDLGEEFQTSDENKVDSTITSQVIVVEDEQDAIDVTVDNKEEVIASSIDEDIRRNNGSEEGDVVSSIDEHIQINNHGNEEVINQGAVNSPEAVTQQVTHDNVTQLSHHTVKEEEDNHDCLSRMGLYTPSSFMQSLRIKYQVVGLEGHA